MNRRKITNPYKPPSKQWTYLSESQKRRKANIAAKRGMVVPGYTRVVGNYGKFQGNGGGEWKYRDYTPANLNPVSGTTGDIIDSINHIPQGTNENQRIGRKVRIRRIQWRYTLTIPTESNEATPPGRDSVRVIMYWDKQTNGAASTTDDILQSQDYKAYRNLTQGTRYEILYDKMHSMNYMGLTSAAANDFSTSAMGRNYSFYKKCDIPVEFNDTQGDMTEIRTNNIGVLCISENGITIMKNHFRIRYSDN